MACTGWVGPLFKQVLYSDLAEIVQTKCDFFEIKGHDPDKLPKSCRMPLFPFPLAFQGAFADARWREQLCN